MNRFDQRERLLRLAFKILNMLLRYSSNAEFDSIHRRLIETRLGPTAVPMLQVVLSHLLPSNHDEAARNLPLAAMATLTLMCHRLPQVSTDV